MRRAVFFLVLMVVLLPAGEAQVLGVQQAMPQFVGASPEASTIASYQSYPVDFLTGSPQVAIPLFEINTKVGKIPLQLSYSIGRIKNSELTGPVGFGWMLEPNIGISRVVHGVADDVGAGYPANSEFGTNTCLYQLALSRNISLDEQPDDFYYSLLNKSGRFVYRRNGSFSTIPYDPVQVNHNSSPTFSIVDEDGTTYNFGKYSIDDGNNYVEYTTTNGTPVATAWKLTEIISYDKADTVRFLYNPTANVTDVPYYTEAWRIIQYPVNPELQPQILMSGVTGEGVSSWMPMRPNAVTGTNLGTLDPSRYYDVIPNIPYITQPCSSISLFPATCGLNYGAVTADPTLLTDHYIGELALTGIVFRGGKIAIGYSGQQISSIQLYETVNQQYSLVKEIGIFQHSIPFSQSQPVDAYNDVNYRTVLDSVLLEDTSGSAIQAYRMQYTALNGSVSGLPLCGGLGSDMFGFPNSTVGTIPAMPFTMGYPFCQMTENDNGTYTTQVVSTGNAMMMLGAKQLTSSGSGALPPPLPGGILQTLVYPTGGSATFDWENNYFSFGTGSAPVSGGGFRIRDIRYKTISGADSLVKTYKYGWGESGLGQVRFVPNAQDFISMQMVNSTHIGDGANILQQITTVTNMPHKDLSFDNGAAVLYSCVAEYLGTPQGNAGKTIYCYHLGAINDTRLPNTPLQEDFRDDWRNWQLDSMKQYQALNGSYSLVKNTYDHYTDITMDTIPVGMAFQQYVSELPSTTEDAQMCESSLYPVVSYLSFNLNPGAKRLAGQTVTTYDPSDTTQFVQVVKSYTYDPVTLFQTSESETNSRNEVRTAMTWYAGNSSQLTGLPANQQTASASLVTANRLNTVIQQQNLVNNIPLVTVQRYYAAGGGGTLYPYQTWSQLRNNPLELKTQINLYDIYGNVLEQQKANDTREVYFWGYHGLYPVAKVVGSDYATASQYITQSVLDNPATTDAQLRAQLNNLRANLPNALVTTYTYSPLVGITSETDPRGVTTYYQYDAFGRLSVIRDNSNNVIKTFEYHYVNP